MPCCCALGCSNRFEAGYRLFLIPQGSKNEERREKWKENIGRSNLPERAYVCEEHFTENQFETNRVDEKRPLKWNAVPTIFRSKKASKSKKPLKSPKSYKNRNQASRSIKICQLPKPIKKRYRTDENVDIGEANHTIKKFKNKKLGCENELIEESNEKLLEIINELRIKLQDSANKVNILEEKLKVYENNMRKVFNSDQMRFFATESMQGITWSDDTINKALKLFLTCGKVGYEEIRKQLLPYPCIRTLQNRSKSSVEITVNSNDAEESKENK